MMMIKIMLVVVVMVVMMMMMMIKMMLVVVVMMMMMVMIMIIIMPVFLLKNSKLDYLAVLGTSWMPKDPVHQTHVLLIPTSLSNNSKLGIDIYKFVLGTS